MIKSFADKHTQQLFENGICHRKWRTFERRALAKLEQIDLVEKIEYLRIPPGNHLERLRGDREGQWSIRINGQYRVCFEWDGENAHNVGITDYHKGQDDGTCQNAPR